MVAWTLGVHTLTITSSPLHDSNPGPAPDIIFQTRAQRHAHLLPRLADWPQRHYRLVAHARTFRVYADCQGRVTL
jgi:hypothetical protein